LRIRWQSELPMWLLLAAMFVLAALTWPGAPERIPVHWNLHMQVDRYGGRFEGLLGLPRVFVVEGLAFMAAGLLRTPWALVASCALLVAGIVLLFVYSYRVWRADPDKLPPAGTTPA